MRSRLANVVLAATSAAVIAACGTAPRQKVTTNTAATSTQASSGVALSRSTVAVLAAAQTLPSVYMSPLNVFANGTGFDSVKLAQYNASIGSCMEAHNWKYYPDPTALTFGLPSRVSAMIQYRSVHGYSSPPLQSVLQDPNIAYVRSLTSAQQKQYYMDLNGSSSELTPQVGSPSGCQPLAMSSLRAALPASNPAFEAAWNTAVITVESSVSFKAAYANWRSCMSNFGYTATYPGTTPKPSLSVSPSAVPPTTVPGDVTGSSQAQLVAADSDMACEVAEVLPTRQALEITQIRALAKAFPQYSERAAGVLSGAPKLP